MVWLSKLSLRLRRQPVAGHLIAIACWGAGLAARFATDSILPTGFPFVTFFPAVIVTTFLAGLWPGMLAGVLSVLAAWYFFIPPHHSFALSPGGAAALGFFILVISVDIAVIHIMNTALERLEAERHRSAALSQQSQTMFAELQHRVSNNLQLVSSLLMIQQSKIADPSAIKVLEEARSRVATLGRLHRMLHDPTRQAVELGNFLRELCRDVIDAAGASKVSWVVEAEPVHLSADKVVPVALIVAELVSNALEHAFADHRPGTVTLSLAKEGDTVRLAVRDSGPGLPHGFDLDAQTSLGLRIVRALAGQLNGRVSMASDRGTVATLFFPA